MRNLKQVTAKTGCQPTTMQVIVMGFSLSNNVWGGPALRQMTSAHLAGDVIQVWINCSSSIHWISHSKAPLSQLRSARRQLTSLVMCAWPCRLTNGNHNRLWWYCRRWWWLVRLLIINADWLIGMLDDSVWEWGLLGWWQLIEYDHDWLW